MLNVILTYSPIRTRTFRTCIRIYCGKIKRHFKDQFCEHIVTSHFTKKKVTIDNNKLQA